VRIGAGLAVSTFLVAVAFGASARDHGWGVVAPVVASLTVFSASAQFALVTALAGGGGAVAAVVSATMINLRFLPMGLAVAGALRGGRLRRALEGQVVVDGSWVAAHQGEGRFDRSMLIGATLPQWPAWVAGTAVGVLVAPPARIEHALALDVVFPAFFVVLLADELRGSPDARRAGLAAALLTGMLLLVLPAGLAILGGSVAALLGLRRSRQ
jgi:predicted branched-subunit amino acid permease